MEYSTSVSCISFLSNWYQSKIKKEKEKVAASERKAVIDFAVIECVIVLQKTHNTKESKTERWQMTATTTLFNHPYHGLMAILITGAC